MRATGRFKDVESYSEEMDGGDLSLNLDSALSSHTKHVAPVASGSKVDNIVLSSAGGDQLEAVAVFKVHVDDSGLSSGLDEIDQLQLNPNSCLKDARTVIESMVSNDHGGLFRVPLPVRPSLTNSEQNLPLGNVTRALTLSMAGNS